MAADDKYPVLNRDTLMIPIQMQLSQKQKKISHLFSVFSISRLDFEHLEEKDYPHRFCIFHVTDAETVSR